MRSAFLFLGTSVLLLGAGCVGDSDSGYTDDLRLSSSSVTRSVERSANGGSQASSYSIPSCDDGMKLFQGSQHDIEFCYPENNGQNGKITVQEESDGVVLSVNGEAMRKIWVIDVEGSERREDIVERYAVVNPAGVVCGVMSAFNDIEGRDVYVLVGEDPSGEQNSSTVAACTYASSDAQGGFDLNVLRSGIFYFYDRVPGTMFVLSSEQDPSLGSQTDAFVASIQPQE